MKRWMMMLLGFYIALGPVLLGSCGIPSVMVSSVAAVTELGNLVLDNDEPPPVIKAESKPEDPSDPDKEYAKKENESKTEGGT